ncbi:MAG: ABC transporter permease [Pseudomonadota bacterium]
MRSRDALSLAWNTLAHQGRRTALIALAMAIGVAAVVVLTALGEGARRYVLDQFAGLGSNLVIVLPGRAETTGAAPGVLSGQTTRDLTLDDALAVSRLPGVARVAPLNVGSVQVSAGKLSREVVLLGSSDALLPVRNMRLGQGRFLPAGPLDRADPVCVLGDQLRRELFGNASPLGQWVRIGDRRMRVIGTLAPQGQQMGFNTDETVVVPVATAQQLFNTPSLFRILVEARGRSAVDGVKARIRDLLKARHDGEEDVTVITQDAVLATFDRILTALTLAVAGIAAISLAVAGVLIMNVMLVSVSQRRAEIGLLKALGAAAGHIRILFLTEAALIALLGGLAGLVLGLGASLALGQFYPDLDFTPPLWAVGVSLATALVFGLLFAWLPARRAAAVDPALSLSRR